MKRMEMVMVKMVMMMVIVTMLMMVMMKICSVDKLKYIDKETRERLLVAFANEVIFQFKW